MAKTVGCEGLAREECAREWQNTSQVYVVCSRGRAVASMRREATYMCIRVFNPSSLSIIYVLT